MTNDEIREAITNVKIIISYMGKDTNAKHYQVLVALAKDYLKAEGWPEEKATDDFQLGSILVNRGFNAALRLCKLAATKEKSRVSKKAILQTLAQGYCTKRNSKKVLDPDLLEDQAIALLELINGKEA